MLSLIILLVLVGLGMYVLEMFIPIDRRIKQVIYILVGLWIFVMLLGMVGVDVPYLSRLR
jgi:hypothetical protein